VLSVINKVRMTDLKDHTHINKTSY